MLNPVLILPFVNCKHLHLQVMRQSTNDTESGGRGAHKKGCKAPQENRESDVIGMPKDDIFALKLKFRRKKS